MSEQGIQTPATTAITFPSLAALRSVHNKLLEAHRTQADLPEFWQQVAAFVHSGSRTGALLDSEEDRWAAQGLLDYWTATATSTGRTMPDGALADFDPTLAPELPDADCPYVGLAAFHEGREKYFFGRDRLVNALLEKVAATRLVAVVGPSGSGKSSLVLAGLIPQLKQGALPGSADWRYLPRMVPGSEPLATLAAIVQPQGRELGLMLTTAAKTLFAEEGLRRADTYLVELFNAMGEQPVVLVIDQFEESFTLCTDDSTRAAFLHNLLALVQAPGPRHTVILTMRSDFENFVARAPDLLPPFETGLLRVTPLNAAELRAVIEKPADMVGLKFEAGVVDALVQDVLGEPAALPLLQFTLLKLWENRARNRITWEMYKRLGGGRLALARSADRLYESLIPEDQVTLRRILLRLVRPGDGLEVTSNRVRQGVLYLTGEAHDRVDRVLTKLVDADLVRLTSSERPEDTQVEVAHEALVRNWPRLVGWLEDERERIRERLRVTEAAEQWLKLGRDTGALLRGALLEDALRYTDLNELEQQYVKASQAALAAIASEREAARQRELDQARTLAAEQEQLARRERQWAEYQAQTATKLRQRAWSLTVITTIMILFAAAGIWLAFRANAESARAALASQEAFVQATAAENARNDAVQQAVAAQTAEAVAQMEAAAARTAEAELRAKQAQLSHLAAALSYTGEQLDELERLISNARATFEYNTQGAGELPAATPTPPTTAPLATATPVATPPPAATAQSPITTTQAVSEAIVLTGTDLVTAAIVAPPISATLAPAPAELSNVIAYVPDVAINLYAEASEKATVLQTLRAPATLTVLQADAYWVKVQTSDSTVGWVEAYLLTYGGDISQLPRELRYRVVEAAKPDTPEQAGGKIPFTYGVVVSIAGAENYPLQENPQNPESQLIQAPVGAPVTLLFSTEGPPTYGSGLWYYVQMADPDGQNVLWQGYLPAAVVEQRQY